MVAESIFGLGWLADTLLADVQKSSEFRIDFSEHPFGLEEFYDEFLPSTTPDKVLRSATNRAILREGLDETANQKTVTLSMWAIVSGVTYALTHRSNMRDGSNKDRYYRPLRDALSNPEEIFEKLRLQLEEQSEELTTTDDSVEERAAVVESELQALRE